MTVTPGFDSETFLTECRSVIDAPNVKVAAARALRLAGTNDGIGRGRSVVACGRALRHVFRAGRRVPAEQVTTDVGQVSLPADDQVVLPWMRKYGSWEEVESHVLRSLLAPGAWVLDIGAHVGYHTLLAGRAVGPSGRVVCLEPNPVNFSLLCQNVVANRVAGARPLPAAVGDETEMVEFGISESNSGDHSFDTSEGRSIVRVVAVRMDDLVDPGWPISVIKTDIQGADHRALAGMRGLITRNRPTILAEFWPAGIEALGDDPLDALSRYLLPEYSIEIVGDGGVEAAPQQPESIVERARRNEGAFVSLLLRPRDQ